MKPSGPGLDAQGLLRTLLKERSERIFHQGGQEVTIIKDQDLLSIAEKSAVSAHETFLAALGLGICPYRYLRNLGSLSVHDQFILASSRVAVIGAGGLGGQIILLLARIGVGHLVVVDRDTFDETNLNRQALCTAEVLGQPKSQVAVDVVRLINPGVVVTSHQVRMDPSNAGDILAGSNVAVDALDNVRDRFVLARAAGNLGIPLIHGAVAGFEGRIMTIFPKEGGMRTLYGPEEDTDAGEVTPEAVLGVPSMTPAMVATLQGMEVVKILLGRGPLMRNRMVHVDLERGDVTQFSFGEEEEGENTGYE